MNKTETIEVTQEQRDLLSKFFKAQGSEKPLSKDEFTKIKDLLDKQRGGLKREAYEAIKGDKELVKGALFHQLHRDHRIMDSQAPKVKEELLKYLRSTPGEKTLSKEEFKTVAIFLDRQNGGIRRHAYQLFKDDKEIMDASKTHRAAWKSQGKAKELSGQTKEAVETMNKNLRKKRNPSQDNGLEPGD